MTLRRFNNFLSFVVVLLGLYIIVAPLVPNILFMFRDDSPEVVAPYGGNLASAVGSSSSSPIPDDNRVVIPGIGLNEPIYESGYISVIKDGGTWHMPNTPTPNEDGNSVIVGHRFYGSRVSTFYHLDKVEVGEVFGVYWSGEEIVYKVTQKKIVEATEVEIEGPTENRQLTLYTCHPLWTSKQRLVIIAEPVESNLINEESEL